MLKPVRALILSSLILSPTLTLAQPEGESITPVPAASTEIRKPWTIRADATAFILKGFGFSVGRAFSRKLETEAFFSRSKMERKVSDLFQATHSSDEIGARVTLMPFSTLEKGLYLSALISHLSLNTEMNSFVSDGPKTLNTSRFGAAALAGFQFTIRPLSCRGRIGGGYGIGGAFSTNYGGTSNSINDSFLVDASLGFVF